MRRVFQLLALVPVVAAVAGCPDDGTTRANLAAGCSLNSECEEPLVCVYKRCHTQCETSRDCGPGQRCVLGERPDHVCQLPDQVSCTDASNCTPGQTCSKDGKCRDACRNDRDCVSEQVCVQGQCAEPDEVQTLTLVGASQGERCQYSSECAGKLVCINGSCDLECIADRDCFATWKCNDTRCVPPTFATNCPGRSDGGVALGGVRSVAAGGSHTCAVRNDQSIWCWGSNVSGQLGQGATDASPHFAPVQVQGIGLGPAVQVVSGNAFTCALTAAGTVYCWGADADGQLGRGVVSPGGVGATPAAVAGLSNITQIAAGANHACAVDKAGSLRCWGRDVEGQLGRGATDAQPRPQPSTVIALGTDVNEVAGYARSTCAVRRTGAVACWGDNAQGQLGRGTQGPPDPNPLPVAVLTANVTSLAPGPLAAHACAVQAGKLHCWGDGAAGQIGDGATAVRPTPTPLLVFGATAVRPSLGASWTCTTTKDGSAWCWGRNDRGMLGDGSVTSTPDPVQVVSLGNRGSQLAGGGLHTCAILKDASLFCWGANDVGQLADGTTAERQNPVLSAVPCPVGP